MNITHFIARRVALSEQKTFSRLIIRIAIAAVAISVAVMIVSTALIAGFKQEIRAKIFGFWGHIHITEPNIGGSMVDLAPIDIDQDFYNTITQTGPISYFEDDTFLGREVSRQKLTKGGIQHIQVFALKPGMIQFNNEIEGIILKGVGPDYDWTFLEKYMQEGSTLHFPDTEVDSTGVEGSSAISREILISRQTADRLQIGVGDEFIVNFVEERGSQLRRRFTVAGIYKTGLEEYDRKFALVDIRQIQQLMSWKPNQVSGFEVLLDNIDDLKPFNDYIFYDVIPNSLYSETIRDKSPEIFDWLDLQNVNEVVILGLMIIVAIINMITALLILILERTNMIGTLKALGSSNWSIRKIFLYYAGYIIIMGLFWGNVIGLGICFIQDRFELIRLSEADYYLSVAPVHIKLWTILVLNLGTLLVILLFLVVPSYIVTRINPVKAIRFK
jgi:lipoprotein-releasing system permease protein